MQKMNSINPKSIVNGQMSIVTQAHIPVLLDKVLEILEPKPGEVFVDGTVDGGGHMSAILEKMKFCGTYMAIDLDNNILTDTRMRMTTKLEALGIATDGLNILWTEGNYRDAPEFIKANGISSADKFLLDLGFSSIQLSAGRGFSYRSEMSAEPLDMRYSTEGGVTVADVVNSMREDELADIIFKYGEERFSRKIAKQILMKRAESRVITVGELVECIEKAVPAHFRKGVKDVISRTFQALRIYINGELENLESILQKIPEIMSQGGRVAIITFHSLEDRMVKNSFKALKEKGLAEIITKRPIIPESEEITENPRSRSSKLRAVIIKKSKIKNQNNNAKSKNE